MSDRRRRRRPPWWWPLPALGLVAALVLGLGASQGGLTARIVNTADRLQSGSLVTAATNGASTECDLSTAAFTPITATSNTTGCSGTLAPSGTLPASGTVTTTTTLAEKGSLNGAVGLSSGVCGPVQLANSATGTDPLLVRGSTLSYAQAGPSSLSGSSALGLSGTSGYAADVAGAAGPSTTSFTEMVWFKTTVGGTLIGFANTPNDYSPGNYDKIMWVDNTGHVVFGVNNIFDVQITSVGAYNNGQWHLAVASVSSTAGMSLTVDGGTPVTNTTTKAAQAYTGYWHVGWDAEGFLGWSDYPSNLYFTGSLANAAVFGSALTPAQISALYGATTQAGEASLINADGATNFWPLGDSGASIYTGTVPQVTPATCSFVDATVGVTGATATCAAPASNSACPTPSGTTTLTTLASRTTAFGPNLTPSQSLAVTLTLARDGTTTTLVNPYATGLHLSSVLALVATAGSFTATVSWPSENIIL
jgi:hypothetical protein